MIASFVSNCQHNLLSWTLGVYLYWQQVSVCPPLGLYFRLRFIVSWWHLIETGPKALFPVTTVGVGKETTLFPGLLHFTLDNNFVKVNFCCCYKPNPNNIKVSKVGSLFNSYYTEVKERVLLHIPMQKIFFKIIFLLKKMKILIQWKILFTHTHTHTHTRTHNIISSITYSLLTSE